MALSLTHLWWIDVGNYLPAKREEFGAQYGNHSFRTLSAYVRRGL
jgi:hypothetical protein